MAITWALANTNNKTWFSAQKCYSFYLPLCKRRNILGAAPGKHLIERHHVPHSARKSFNKACLVAKYIFSITTPKQIFQKLSQKK